jgi:hypothetical protein
MRRIKIVILFICVFIVSNLNAQNNKQQLANSHLLDTSVKGNADTTIVAEGMTAKDTLAKKKHDPAKATRRSAIIPGWGQAYNHQYWKIPIVYGALAIPAATFVYNNTWYKKTRDAYEIVVNEETDRYNEIDPKLQPLVNDPASLQYYRNEFRRNRDYSILFFLVAWGLNVVDATVFGHLKDFDVSDNLSMQFKPNYNIVTKQPNVGVAFNIRTPAKKPLPSF